MRYPEAIAENEYQHSPHVYSFDTNDPASTYFPKKLYSYSLMEG